MRITDNFLTNAAAMLSSCAICSAALFFVIDARINAAVSEQADQIRKNTALSTDNREEIGDIWKGIYEDRQDGKVQIERLTEILNRIAKLEGKIDVVLDTGRKL